MSKAYTPEWVEREYNNRALVPGHGEYFARWERDSAYVRSTLACTLDIPYGGHARQAYDYFPAADARGTLVFIHGGYWRSLDKRMFSWLAASWVAAGVNVAMINYRLAPTVRIEDIIEDSIAALNAVMEKDPSTRVVVSGHSAGGHLTAALFATDPSRFRFELSRVAGGVPVSAVVDFTPLEFFSGNADLRLDAGQIARLNLGHRPSTIKAPLVVAAGAAESAEFQRQSQLLADSWAPQVKSLLLLPGIDHFSVVDAFAERGQPLYEQALALF